MLSLHFVKKILFVHVEKETQLNYENSDEPMQDPETKLKVEFSFVFWCNTTVTGGEVLQAAATQHTLQISIQLK
jgi:hypothetical protein